MAAPECGLGRVATEEGRGCLYARMRISTVDTLVHHPASTSHRQFSPEQQDEAGISAGLVRVSLGCEDADDIVDDFDRALAEL